MHEDGSLPSRGAWIEIIMARQYDQNIPGRSPHGERGLKSYSQHTVTVQGVSLPSRGAWIEISVSQPELVTKAVAPLTGSVN